LLRPFGLNKEDLEINFNHTVRPHLITEILQSCMTEINGHALERSFFWKLTIGKRIEFLLMISMIGSEYFSFTERCTTLNCKKQMEVSLAIAELINMQLKTDDDNSSDDKIAVRINDQDVFIRKPTGQDQLEWLSSSFTNEYDAILAIIKSLLLIVDENGSITTSNNYYPRSSISKESIDIFNSALMEADPLVNFHLSIVCPYCGKEDDYHIDLEEQALAIMQDTQNKLFEQVHRLAQSYHWNEQEILTLAPWKRLRYLSLIEKEEGDEA